MSVLSAILREIVVPAIGCTEIGAIALASAAAREAAGGEPRRVTLALDPSTFKNALAVTIPNTGGLSGIGTVAALGALYGQSKHALEVLKDITPEKAAAAAAMERDGLVKTAVRRRRQPPYVEARVVTSSGWGRAVIEGSHTSIVLVETNHGPVPVDSGPAARKTTGGSREKLAAMDLGDIVSLALAGGPEQADFLLKAASTNFSLAEEGLARRKGLAVGANFDDMIKSGVISNDLVNRAKLLVAGGVDARMAGSSLPAMTNTGSGNQGIVTMLPVVVVAGNWGTDRVELSRALALANLLAAHVRLKTGELSTICGSAVAGAVGAAAGIMYLLNGKADAIDREVMNIVANITGMLCGGANSACALKLATAAGVAVETAFMTSRSTEVAARKGLAGDNVQETLQNLSVLSKSLGRAGDTILDIMRRNS